MEAHTSSLRLLRHRRRPETECHKAAGRAGHFIDSAAALNYDEHERTAPAAYAAGMMPSPLPPIHWSGAARGDSRWLDAAVDALSSCDGWGQLEMRHTLLVVRQDDIIEPRESRTIEVAVAQAPERVELRDATLASKELAMAVSSVLQTYPAALTTTGA